MFDRHRGRAIARAHFHRQALTLGALAVFFAALGVWIFIDTGDWVFGVGLVVAAGLYLKGASGFRRWTDEQFGDR